MTPTQAAALHTELTTDPAGLGYAPFVADGSDTKLAELLNAPTATDVFRNDVRLAEVIDAIVAADFVALTPGQKSSLQLLGMSTIDATKANTRQILAGIFTGMAGTVSNLQALTKRKGSRAEILGGVGTTITADDVAQALRGVG